MGQKINPIGFRLSIQKNWSSQWYANTKEFPIFVSEDIKVREYLHKKLSHASVGKIVIERPSKKARITIRTSRPGVVIGKKGEDIEALRCAVQNLMTVPVHINVEEIRKPEIDSQLIASNIAQQVEKRIPPRRAMKRAIQNAMGQGAQGIKIMSSGRLNGIEIARTEWYREGKVPLHTLRDEIDYATAEAKTTYGVIGVKVWVSKGEQGFPSDARARKFDRRLERTARSFDPQFGVKPHNLAESIKQYKLVGDYVGSDKLLKLTRGPEQRRVVVDLYDVTDKESRPKVEERLRPKRRYELELFIAAKHQGMIVAEKPFPTEMLPPGEHKLSVHFVPLIRGEDGAVLPSQHEQLILPATVDSKACTFSFAVPLNIETYRARLIISYLNRVLQTLILSAPIGYVEGKFLLDVENLVDPSFEELSTHPPFDAAILINDSPSGVPGFTALREDKAEFEELNGLDVFTKKIRDSILKNAAYPAPERKYESKHIRELIYELSRYGKALWEVLPDKVHNLLKDVTTRVQVVDLRSGAYFPAEFLYRGLSPLVHAKLCPNSAAALRCPVGKSAAEEPSHQKCEYRDDPGFICPIRMWGFGMVIEHQPATQQGFILRDITNRASEVRRDVFNRVVASVSTKVTEAEKNGAKVLVAALNKVAKKVSFAENWTDLTRIVHNESPTLLVLLPDSGVDKEYPTIPALELGGEWLAYDRLEKEYIVGPKSDQPILLLLGCHTAVAEIPFLNFIKRFKDCGAAMVMGTITQVDAQRTVDFVERFVEAVAASNERSVTLGELLLRTRRSMLAGGDGYALSLLAYGDTDQQT